MKLVSLFAILLLLLHLFVSINSFRLDYVASGSSIPDCPHACGPCTPCKLVVVSSKCSASESEACPVVYKCLCKGKYYHVPSIA
ncbi:hypothetical protein N665_1195s0011 [Sinapis alba]|nr:hypothetical protein N665_1195s0011 [Sinapis alba]